MKKILTLIFLSTAAIASSAQESIIKKFAEPRRPTVWMNPIALYPSTLRMANISGDPEYYKLVNDIEKALIYTLDSATFAEKNYKSWMKEYEDIGYEEYVSLSGSQTMRVIGKEEEYVGLLVADQQVMVFYLRGTIPFDKIPALMQTFQSGDVLGILTEQFIK